MRRCILDVISIYGVPLRNALVGEARRWCDENELRARFVRMVLPDYASDEARVSDYVTDAEADAG